MQGDFRLTEQGETIAQKYANLPTAAFNLELLLAGVAAVSIEQATGHAAQKSEVDEVWEVLARASTEAYTAFVHAEGFTDFYSYATPIDALEVTRIGSRPARRTGRRTLADLRAIPWVFSWNQSRYYLPGWYGVGSGLEALAQNSPETFAEIRANLRESPVLYYVLTNVETNLASADIGIMAAYADLVPDPAVRDAFFGRITQEFEKTRSMLDDIFQGRVEDRRPRMLNTLQRRAEALSVLHRRQIALLREWRGAKSPEEAAALLPRVLLSINAIAQRPAHDWLAVPRSMKLIRYLDARGRIGYASQQPVGSGLVIAGDIVSAFEVTSESADIRKLLAPLDPVSILCIGLNYRRHAEETGARLPSHPVLFMKQPAAVQNPGDPIELPTHLASERVDFEGELPWS